MQILTNLSEPFLYIVAFAIIFAETGLPPFFFLPGDTLLFSLGIFAHQSIVSLTVVISVIVVAAFLGNIIGYYLGSFLRKKRRTSSLLKRIPEKHILKTEMFYKKYGSWTVLLSRFVPVVRTIAPFLAGVSKMKYKTYILFSFLGAILWAVAIITSGFIFGSYISIKYASYIAIGLMITASILTPLLLFLSKKYLKKS